MRTRWEIVIAAAWLGLACSAAHAPAADELTPSADSDAAGSAGSAAQSSADANDRDPGAAPVAGVDFVGRAAGPLPDRPPHPGTGPAKPNVPAPSPADPPQPQPDPDLPAPDPDAAALLGHWFGHGQVGDCLGVRHWYSFEQGGRVTARGIDHNACFGVRLLSTLSGGYTVSGGELMISLAGPGSEPVFEMTQPLAVEERHERFTYAIGESPATATQPAQTFLDAKAFRSVDGKRYDSMRFIHFLDATGTALFMQEVDLSLHMSRALPVSVGSVVDVVVHARLTHFEQATGVVATTDTIELGYPAAFRDSAGWRVLEPTAFEGKSNEEAIAIWQMMLGDAGIAGHPPWAQRVFQAHFFPSQRHQAGDVALLSSTLPEHGRWTRSTEPPPPPSSAP